MKYFRKYGDNGFEIDQPRMTDGSIDVPLQEVGKSSLLTKKVGVYKSIAAAVRYKQPGSGYVPSVVANTPYSLEFPETVIACDNLPIWQMPDFKTYTILRKGAYQISAYWAIFFAANSPNDYEINLVRLLLYKNAVLYSEIDRQWLYVSLNDGNYYMPTFGLGGADTIVLNKNDRIQIKIIRDGVDPLDSRATHYGWLNITLIQERT